MAAISTRNDGHPMFVKINPVASFTTQAITDWARQNLLPGCDVRSVGLACLARVIDAGCAHSCVTAGERRPRELPQFTWVDTVLGNLTIMVNGAHKAFKFRKYGRQYLGALCYRFNRRFDLRHTVFELIGNGVHAKPLSEHVIRGRAEAHD